MNYLLNFIIIAVIIAHILVGCASKRTVKLTEKYPSKNIKSYQVISTYQKCRENCRIVKTIKRKKEFYEDGTLKAREKTVNESTVDGDFHSLKTHAKLYDEKGRISKKVKKDDLEGTTYLYENGKLKSKTSFDQ
jgi:hypothetical protein